MKWIIDEQVIERLGKKIKRRDRKERVFVLIGTRQGDTTYVRSFVSVVNRAEDPTEGFVVVGSDLPQHTKSNAVGVAHSHTWRHPAEPSESDIERIPEGQIGIVLHSTQRVATVYDRSGPLLRRDIKSKSRRRRT